MIISLIVFILLVLARSQYLFKKIMASDVSREEFDKLMIKWEVESGISLISIIIAMISLFCVILSKYVVVAI